MKLSKRIFALTLAGLLLLLAVLDRAVGIAAQDSTPRRQMARVRNSSGASVLALGNSLIGVGFVESSFDEGMEANERAREGALNLAMGGSSALEQLLMLRYALRQGVRSKAVVFGFFDFNLTHPLEYATHDLIENHAMLYYVEPEFARRFYHLSLHDRIEFQVMRHFELFVDRGTVWADVERFRRTLSQQGMPPEKANAMGRAIDFRMLEYPSRPAFIEECGRASRRDLIPAVRELVVEAVGAGSRTYFIEMPMPPAHVQAFYDAPAWAAYRDHLRTMLSQLGASYIDASHWMPDDSSFSDPLHLSYEGSKEFSKRLGASLKAQID